jgi:hypothetical protein
VRGYNLSALLSDLTERLRLGDEAKSGTIPTWPPAPATEEAEA